MFNSSLFYELSDWNLKWTIRIASHLTYSNRIFSAHSLRVLETTVIGTCSSMGTGPLRLAQYGDKFAQKDNTSIGTAHLSLTITTLRINEGTCVDFERRTKLIRSDIWRVYCGRHGAVMVLGEGEGYSVLFMFPQPEWSLWTLMGAADCIGSWEREMAPWWKESHETIFAPWDGTSCLSLGVEEICRIQVLSLTLVRVA
jgi:hypothetical protein